MKVDLPRGSQWRRARLSAAEVVLLLLIEMVALALVPGPASAAPATPPRNLPSHFGWGLAASPPEVNDGGWLPQSGIPWDYANQYLAGGTNTGAGGVGSWQTWNSNAQFPLWYAQSAAAHNYVPVLTYYNLLQSNGPCNSCGETERDLANLNSPSVMASFYSDFAKLMKRLGPGTYDGVAGFGGQVIVHVEPDLSGYANQVTGNQPWATCYTYCSGAGNDPTLLNASVASSGIGEVAAYPNNFAGFNWALLHLRDLYAPNVVMAAHISDWAPGPDIGYSNSPSWDINALGQKAGSFMAQAGVVTSPPGTSTYDLIFNDVLDRDAGFYAAQGQPGRWWDRLNSTFPNFHRWEEYMKAIQSVTGKASIVWQVPIGNQWFRSENNSTGHYQDNRAEYFFSHVDELVDAGVIAALFGAGAGGQSMVTDAQGDGITNPPSFCTAAGISTGQVCNDHVSSYPDDDGGFIRLAAQSYYQNPHPLGGTVPVVLPPPPTDDHPWYFAEGTTRPGFDEYLTIANPYSDDAAVTITYSLTAATSGTRSTLVKTLSVPSGSRSTVHVNDAAGAGAGPNADVSALVKAGHGGVIVERPMYFSGVLGDVDGGHVAAGVGAPSTDWLFAEGTTRQGFREFLTLQNPQPIDVTATLILAIRPASGDPPYASTISRRLPALSRTTVDMNSEIGIESDVSVGVTATAPIVAERPVYFSGVMGGISDGHVAPGTTAPTTTWIFAEGYTGAGFKEYLTILNPNASSATATFTVMPRGEPAFDLGPFALEAKSRATFDINSLAGSGREISLKVNSTLPIAAERPMYFAGVFGGVNGGHVASGVAGPASTWQFAEGYTGAGFKEYITIANPSPSPATVTPTVLPNGAPAFNTTPVVIPSGNRMTLDMNVVAGSGRELGVRLTSDQPVVAERPIYFSTNFGGRHVDGGSNVVGVAG